MNGSLKPVRTWIVAYFGTTCNKNIGTASIDLYLEYSVDSRLVNLLKTGAVGIGLVGAALGRSDGYVMAGEAISSELVRIAGHRTVDALYVVALSRS